jgi:hypothetical protein
LRCSNIDQDLAKERDEKKRRRREKEREGERKKERSEGKHNIPAHPPYVQYIVICKRMRNYNKNKEKVGLFI